MVVSSWRVQASRWFAGAFAAAMLACAPPSDETPAPGYENGPCIQGSCLGGLECISDVCGLPQPDPGTGSETDAHTPGTSSGPAATTSSGAPDPVASTSGVEDTSTGAAGDDDGSSETTGPPPVPCPLGEPGCPCMPAAVCTDGYCVDGMCIAERDYEDPYDNCEDGCNWPGVTTCWGDENNESVCAPPCTEPRDCPPGIGAAFPPDCLSNGTVTGCTLECNSTNNCPPGMTCYDAVSGVFGHPGYCAWPWVG